MYQNGEKYMLRKLRNVEITVLMDPDKVLHVLFSLLVSALIFAIFLIMSGPLWAAEIIQYVAPTGDDSTPCTISEPCLTIQQAISNVIDSGAGNEIRVASGKYNTVNNMGNELQVVYVPDDIVLLGGFTTTNWLQSDPVANKTYIDAQNSGRGIYIPEEVAVRISGFRILNGLIDNEPGAGIYNKKGTLTVENC